MTKLCHNVYDHKILYDFNNAENQTFLYKVIALELFYLVYTLATIFEQLSMNKLC